VVHSKAVLDANHGSVLLIFRRGATASGRQTPEGFIPPHDGQGPAHIAFAISAKRLDAWSDISELTRSSSRVGATLIAAG
jgi:hypothetical protein